MHALVFADRLGAELEPLTERCAVPMLPVAGKELLIYTLEEVVAAGIREIVVVAAAHGQQVGASTLGEGERWGCNIRYVLSRGEEAPSEVWTRLSLGDEAVVALRGDILRSPVTAEFLQAAQDRPGNFAFFGGDDGRAGLLLLRPGCSSPGSLLDSLHWNGPAQLPGEGGCDLGDRGLVNTLEDLAAFHRANLDLVAGRFPGLGITGRVVSLGLHAGRGAKVSPKSLKKGVAYVGDNSRVHPEAEFVGEVMVAHDVVVDRAATLRDSVIMPQTYVGELVEVANAIISGGYLMRVDTGAKLNITEAFLLGGLGGKDVRRRTSLLDRLAGGLLLLVSFPLWPVAAAAAALSAAPLTERQTFVGNRSSLLGGEGVANGFTVTSWNTPIPVLRHLPWLLAVVKGDLRLVGVAPLSPEESQSRTEEWERVRDQAPVGLLGPTQLNLSRDAPLEERLLSDAFFAREQSMGKNMRYLWQGLKSLFSGDAWSG